MRIVSWNCCMAYRGKNQLIDIVRPNIAMIQEISCADVEASDARFRHWVGRNPAKGMGILGFADHQYAVAEGYTDHIPWFIPITVDDVHILAIWASTTNTNARRYVRLIHEALDHYREFLNHPNTILIGDFNSNAIFDGKHPAASHSHLVERLLNVGISSVYHAQSGDAHGSEQEPTFFLHRSLAKPYHFDYAFVSQSLRNDAKLAIGGPDHYLGPSDHLPLILDIRP